MKGAGPPADLVEDFALPLTLGVISDLLGVPEEDRGRFRVWSGSHLSTSVLSATETTAQSRALHAYITGLTDRRRADPADDLLSDLIEARTRMTDCPETNLCRW